MEWQDKAIIIKVKKHGDKNGIATLLTENHGKCYGYVYNIASPKMREICQAGSIVEVNWRARLSNQLGHFNLQMIKHNAGFLYNDNLKITALNNICFFIEKLLAENEEHKEIYYIFYDFLESLDESNSLKLWLQKYIFFEILLLKDLGFGLTLNECCVCNDNINLHFVSPKSGRAVCFDDGKQYMDKLFLYPSFFITKNIDNIRFNDLYNGLKLTRYFINKYLLEPNDLKENNLYNDFHKHIKKYAENDDS